MCIEKVLRRSLEFREAIERSDKSKLPVSFSNFPRGSCGDAVPLLARYLESCGLGSWLYVSGVRSGELGDGSFFSHAWIRNEELVVDITADQFEDFFEKVFVASSSEWHASFKITDEHVASFDVYGESVMRELEATYLQVMSFLSLSEL